MYLEISARQTGKTTRLIENLLSEAYSSDAENSIVFCHTKNSAADLKNTVKKIAAKKPLTRKYFKKIRFTTLTENSLRGISSETYLYFDEFDFVVKNRLSAEIIDLLLEEYPNLYFVTTPARLRSPDEFSEKSIKTNNDLLLKVLAKNNYVYETTINSKLISNMDFQDYPITEKFGTFVKEKDEKLNG